MPNPSRIAIYTAISNDYNLLLNPSCLVPDADYYCFTDDVIWRRLANNTLWQIKPFPVKRLDPVRLCRAVKILPHLLFPDYEYSVWIDASIDVIGNTKVLLESYGYPDMLCFSHPQRTCIYQEGTACIDKSKDNPQLISEQLDTYRRLGFPADAGLIESGVLIRRHNDPTIKKVMDDWWFEVKNRSRRDQLSFPYVARKNGFWPTTMGQESVWGSSQFFTLRARTYHGDKKVTLGDKLSRVIHTHLSWRFKK